MVAKENFKKAKNLIVLAFSSFLGKAVARAMGVVSLG
jgi:hypothetical protein